VAQCSVPDASAWASGWVEAAFFCCDAPETMTMR